LNNVVRHARATRCEVTFSGGGDDVVIDVVDDGSGSGDRAGEGGLGLSSMAARAAEVGGYVIAGAQAGHGFRVQAVVPGATP
jgi:two-component system, NarL family, sensor histidine kinase DesK